MATYKKRQGTTDWGKRYEEYLPAYIVTQLLQKEEVKDFRVSTNDNQFGDFDDLIIEVEHNNGRTEKYAISLKHKYHKYLKINDLQRRKYFNIIKYHKSFQDCFHQLLEHRLILFTNAEFTPDSNTTIDLENDESVKVKVTECDPFLLINTPEKGRSFQFQLDPENSKEIKQKYKDFFERFFLYTNQMNVQQLEEEYIIGSFRALTSRSFVTDKFLKFISKWSVVDGIKNKLTKDMMMKVITLHIAEGLIQPHTFCEVNEKKKLFQTAISHFNITAFNNKSLENVVKIWGDSKNILQDYDIKIINKMIRQFQISTKYICKIEELTDEESTKLLWVMDKCPLIIQDHPGAYEAATLCGGKSKFVFITDKLKNDKLKELTVFKTLSDLKIHHTTYNDILKKFAFTLFGKKTHLEDLIKKDRVFKNLLTTDQFANMTDNLDIIKLKEEQLCFPYVGRHLNKSIIDFNYLLNLEKNTMVLISNVTDAKKLRVKFQNFQIIPLNESIRSGVPSEQMNLVVNTSETSREQFNMLKEKNEKYQNFHHFRWHEKCFEWIESIGDVSDLQKFFIKNYNFVEDEKLYAENIRSNLKIIVGDPGMGKSVFIKNVKNNLLSKYFTVLIQPIDIPELCRFIKVSGDFQKLFSFILQSQFSNSGNFERQVLKLFMENRKAVFLWDALDELSEKDRKFVEELICTLRENSVAQFLTSRRFLRKHLEHKFSVLCQELQPFDDKEQTNYIQERLKNISCNEELEAIITSIKKNIADTPYRDTLCVPHHIYMLTEFILQGFPKSKNRLSGFFTITDFFFHLIEKKIDFYFKEKRHFPHNYKEDTLIQQSLSFRIKNYQLVAIKSIFGNAFSVECYTNPDFLNKMKYEGDEFGLITTVEINMQPEFLHNSYAEYFAATYLAENCRNISNLDIIFERKYTNVRYFFDLLLAKNSPVHVAVLCKNLKYLEDYNGKDELKTKDSQGRNALHLAGTWGERYPLLETSENSEDSTLSQRSILNFETKKERTEYHQIMDVLLKNCNPNETDDLFNLTPSMYAEKCECLFAAAIIGQAESKSYLKTKDERFINSLLYYAIKYEFFDIVNLFDDPKVIISKNLNSILRMVVDNNQPEHHSKLLRQLIYRQNMNYRNLLSDTSLLTASQNGYIETMKYLSQHNANVDSANNDAFTSLMVAAKNKHFETVKYVIHENANSNAVNNHGSTSFDLLAEHRDLETDKCLIQKNTHVNATRNNGRQPFHSSVENEHPTTVTKLISEIADIKAINDNGGPSLHLAADEKHFKTRKYLIQEEANIKANKVGWTPLHSAAENGHLETVKYLIEKKANVNAADADGWIPLHSAVENGHLETVEYLIKRNANVNAAENYYQFTPLHLAVGSGHLKTVKYLIKEKMNVNAVDHNGRTPLHLAAFLGYLETVEYLIQQSANVNAAASAGETPLFLAAFNGHLKTVKFLKQQNAKVNAVTKNGFTPLMVAAENGHLQTVEYLVQQSANVNAAANQGHTPLYLAAFNGHLETVKYLKQQNAKVDAADKDGFTPLIAAAKDGHLETVEYLVQQSANVNAAANQKQTPLYLAAFNGHLETVKYLKQQNAKVDAADKDGYTPLMAAAKDGHLETVEYLVQQNANVNAAANQGQTPLYLAALNGHLETVKYLKQQNAIIDAATTNGFTPLMAAAQDGHLETVKYLVQQSANVNAAANQGQTPLYLAALNGHLETVKYLKQQNAKVDAADEKGFTPLMVAAQNGHLETVNYLMQEGASINVTAKDGTTLLWSAASGGLLETVTFLKEQNLNVDAANDDGLTPLMAAAKKRHLDVVRYLIQQKSYIDASDKNGLTPLHWASDQGHLSVVELLTASGAKIDVYNRKHETPFEKAFARGHETIVEFLIKSGDSENMEEKDKITSTKNSTSAEEHPNMVETLSQDCADFRTSTTSTNRVVRGIQETSLQLMDFFRKKEKKKNLGTRKMLNKYKK